MSNGLSSLPVERLPTAAASAPSTQSDAEPGITLTPPTPAVLPTASSSHHHHQHEQNAPESGSSVPKGFNELEHRIEDGLSADDYTSDDYEEEEATGNDEAMQALIQEAEQAWSQEEIDHLMDDLREQGMLNFLKKYYVQEKVPIRKLLIAFGLIIPPSEDAISEEPDLLRVLKMAISRVLRRRSKRSDINTISDVIRLLKQSSNIIVLSGAGVSTSCGIPDFRSADGIYANLRRTREDLTDPQEMFDIQVFKRDPTIFYSFAKELYPTNFLPSPSHHFVRLLEKRGKLLRNYSQNIDTLEQKAGIENVLNCHGSFAQAECVLCHHSAPGESIKEDIFAGRVPLCPKCTSTPEYKSLQAQLEKKQKQRQMSPKRQQKFSMAWDAPDQDEEDDAIDEELEKWGGQPLVKPTITFFGEKLSDDFDKNLFSDRDKVDMVIVMGTSLRVAPVSELLGHLPHSTPQILINRDPVAHHQFDVALLGDSDAVVQHLCDALSQEDESKWQLPVASTSTSVPPADAASPSEPVRVGESHVYLFPGANAHHRWVQQFDPAYQRATEGGLTLPGRSSRSRSRSRSRSTSPGVTDRTSRSRSRSASAASQTNDENRNEEESSSKRRRIESPH